MITECQKLAYKNAGYSYYISYKEWNPEFGDYVFAAFPTTADALTHHLKSIKSRDTVQLEVTQL